MQDERLLTTKYQVFNKELDADLTQFVMNKLKCTQLDEAWVSEVWQYLSAFEIPELVIQRLDNFWHPLCHHQDLASIDSFLQYLQDFIEKNPSQENNDLLLQYQDEARQLR